MNTPISPWISCSYPIVSVFDLSYSESERRDGLRVRPRDDRVQLPARISSRGRQPTESEKRVLGQSLQRRHWTTLDVALSGLEEESNVAHPWADAHG